MSSTEYITFSIGNQLFGAAVSEIHDVFSPTNITPIPLSSPDIAGILNLRGRIVLLIDARARLKMKPRTASDDNSLMAIGIERGTESYGLAIDSIGEVLRLENTDCEANPANMNPNLASVSHGVYPLEKELLVILDMEKLLNFESQTLAA